MNEYTPQDNHNCTTQCINNICRCIPDKKEIGDKMVTKLNSPPIGKNRMLEATQAKQGS